MAVVCLASGLNPPTSPYPILFVSTKPSSKQIVPLDNMRPKLDYKYTWLIKGLIPNTTATLIHILIVSPTQFSSFFENSQTTYWQVSTVPNAFFVTVDFCYKWNCVLFAFEMATQNGTIVKLVGVSLSEPHTSWTALQRCICMEQLLSLSG